MENLKHSQISKIEDIRQSEQWAQYLESLGWYSQRTSKGTNIEFTKSPLGSFVKVQRPSILESDEIKEIEQICKKNGAMFIKIEPNITQDLSKLKEQEYKNSYASMAPPSTIYIELKKNQDNLWKDISRSGKYSINRAKREKTKTEVVKNPTNKDLQKLFELMTQTQTLKKFRSVSIKDLQLKRDIFGENCLTAFCYDSKGSVNGGKMYLAYKNCVWYMHGGTSNEGRKNKSGYLMVWDTINFLKSMGFHWLDLEGIDDERFPVTLDKWGGFSHFKEKFGGEKVQFPLPQVKYLNRFFKFLNEKGVANL